MMNRALAVVVVSCCALGFLWWAVTSSHSVPAATPHSERALEPPSDVDVTPHTAPIEPAMVAAESSTRVETDIAPISETLPSNVPDETPRIRGRVVNDLDDPVSRFTIRALPVSERDNDPFREESESKLILREFNSTDGNFVLGDLSPEEWTITALGPGYLRSAPRVVGVPTIGEAVTLVLPRGASIAGLVENDRGGVVSGAQIHVWNGSEREPSFHSHAAPTPRAVSDARGQFQLDGLLPGRLMVMARHDEYSDTEWKWITLTAGNVARVSLQLTSGGRIEGYVDPSQAPVGDRQISLFSLRGSMGWTETKSDARGSFVIEKVMPQDYIIELRNPGYPSVTIDNEGRGLSGIRKKITVAAGETTRVVIGAPIRTILVHGVLTSKGQPVGGMTVQSYSQDGQEDNGQRFTTDLDGHYELTVNAPGAYRFMVRFNSSPCASFSRKVIDADRVQLDFELPSGRITGRVLGADGAAVPRALITVLRAGYTDMESFWDCYRCMQTDGDGTFEFRLLPAGDYTLRTPGALNGGFFAPSGSYGRVVIPDLHVDEDLPLAPLEIRLPPEGFIDGQVLDALGNAVVGVSISVEDSRGWPLSALWETRTDATGHFHVPNVGPGAYTVSVYRGQVESSSIVRVEAGMTASIRIDLR